MLEVFNNQFVAIADQMGATLENTAYSVNIKERLDFSCALFDARGDLVANAPHVPVHLGSMSESVKKILHENAGRIRPGDVFMMNNPFNGGTHLPDVTVITPVFGPAGTDGGAPEIVATVASRGHHADIGGRTPGSAPPDSRHITEEGVVIDNFRLVSEGVLEATAARDLLLSGDYPCRNVEQGAGEVQPLLDIDRVGRVLQRRAHLVGDGHELVVEDFEHDRVYGGSHGVLPRQPFDPAQQQIATRQALRPPARLDHGRARVFGQQRRAVDGLSFSQPQRRTEHGRPRRPDRRQQHRGAGAAGADRAVWTGDGPRLHGPCQRQRRRERAPGHRRARRRALRPPAGHGRGNPGGDQRRPRPTQRPAGFHRHLGAGPAQLQCPGLDLPGGGALRLPNAGGQEHSHERGLPAAAGAGDPRGLDDQPALPGRRNLREHRGQPGHRRDALRRAGGAGGLAGDDEQLRLRQRAGTELRNHLRGTGAGPDFEGAWPCTAI